MKCKNCGHEQEQGKFCAECGGNLEVIATKDSPVTETNEEVKVEEEIAAATNKEQEEKIDEIPNEFVSQAKESTLNYFNYLLDTLKKPSSFFDKKKSEYVNGLITLSLLSLFFGLTSYIIASKASKSLFGISLFKVSFAKTFFSSFFGIIIAAAVIVGTLYLVIKLFSNEQSFERVFTTYFAHLTIPLGLVLLAFLMALIGVVGFASSLFAFASALTVGLTPLFIVTNHLTRHSKSIDAFYGFIIYVVVVGIVTGVVFRMFIGSLLGGIGLPF